MSNDPGARPAEPRHGTDSVEVSDLEVASRLQRHSEVQSSEAAKGNWTAIGSVLLLAGIGLVFGLSAVTAQVGYRFAQVLDLSIAFSILVSVLGLYIVVAIVWNLPLPETPQAKAQVGIILSCLIVLFIVSGAVLFVFFRQTSPSEASTLTATSSQGVSTAPGVDVSRGHRVSKLTSKQFDLIGQDAKTTEQAHVEEQPYEGVWLRLAGKVMDIDDSPVNLQISNTSDSYDLVFFDQMDNYFEKLRVGDHVYVICQIDGGSYSHCYFEREPPL